MCSRRGRAKAAAAVAARHHGRGDGADDGHDHAGQVGGYPSEGNDRGTARPPAPPPPVESPYVLMLRVCQGRVSPLDGLSPSCMPRPLLQLALLCCSPQPEARPQMHAMLEQLQGNILRAVDPTGVAELRPATPLVGWREAAEKVLPPAPPPETAVAAADAQGADPAANAADTVGTADAAVGVAETAGAVAGASSRRGGDLENAVDEEGGGDATAPASRRNLGIALIVAGLLMGAALLAGLLVASTEAEEGEEGEESEADATRRAWSLVLVSAMACSLLVGGCTVAAYPPSRRPRRPRRPPKAAEGSVGGDHQSTLGRGAMAEHQAGHGDPFDLVAFCAMVGGDMVVSEAGTAALAIADASLVTSASSSLDMEAEGVAATAAGERAAQAPAAATEPDPRSADCVPHPRPAALPNAPRLPIRNDGRMSRRAAQTVEGAVQAGDTLLTV